MYQADDFLKVHEIWEKQAKQFFEKNAALLDPLLRKPFSEGEWADLIQHFKEQFKDQPNYFDFIFSPPPSQSQASLKYYSLLSTMTEEALDLLYNKIRAGAVREEQPQSLREFYELWLECGEEVYQKWLKNDQFLSAFREMVNGIFG